MNSQEAKRVAPCQDRTGDLQIMRLTLYQLSQRSAITQIQHTTHTIHNNTQHTQQHTQYTQQQTTTHTKHEHTHTHTHSHQQKPPTYTPIHMHQLINNISPPTRFADRIGRDGRHPCYLLPISLSPPHDHASERANAMRWRRLVESQTSHRSYRVS